MSTIEARWATETVEWAPVEAKHAEMHYLRRAAIAGARTIMDHVGLEEVHPDGRVVDLSTLRDYQWRQSKMIPLDDSEAGETGLRYARIQEAHRPPAASGGPRPGFYGRLSRIGRHPDLGESRPRHDRTRLVIIKFGAEENATVTPMLSDTNLDVRRNFQSSPEAMTNHYQQQIDSIATFIGELDELAQVTQTYIYPRHISEELEDREAGN